MAEPKWTPGPWEIKPTLDGDAMILGTNGDKSEYVGTVTLRQIACPFPALEEWIKEKRMANARLIAAAPDLYEACEAALEHLLYLRRMVRGPRVSGKTIELLEAALRKARGEDA